MKSKDIKELHKWLNNLLKEKYINKADIKQILNDFDWGDESNLVEARVSPKVADEDKGLGKCMEKNCNKLATIDYNGHKHYVCKYHYEKLTREFEEDYD